MTIALISLGPYSIPKRGLAELLDQTKQIYKEIGMGFGSNTQIMSILGYTAKSESFYKNTDDLEAFCLIEWRKKGRSKEISLTHLALRVIDEDIIQNVIQKHVALEKIFDSFELWKKLRERFNDSNELNGFSQALADITGEKPDEKIAESIKRSYRDDLKFLNDELSDFSATKQDNQNSMVSNFEVAKNLPSEVIESSPKIAVGSITYPESGVSIEIKDELSFEIAQMLLEAMRKQLGIAKKPTQTSL